MSVISLCLSRVMAMMIKEFRQILRDRATLAMIVAMPLTMTLLFGYAINTNPRNLPTAIVLKDDGQMTRSFLNALKNTGYFDVISVSKDQDEADRLMKGAKIIFALQIPPNFERELMRKQTPQILLSMDATDPAVTSGAAAALQIAFDEALARDSFGYVPQISAFELIAHSRYNPEVKTPYQVVPGLMGLLMSLMMMMLTSIAMTRERERGTMENLLATPLSPFEVMLGKIVPYLLIGYLQACAMIAMGVWLFRLPSVGDLAGLMVASTLLMAANLGVGFTFSTVAKNQLQAMQMTYLFFLPSMLLSGFMFPFYGMPVWAQNLGDIFPLTHFLRISRGLWLKGSNLSDFSVDLWAIGAFLLASTAVAMWRYKKTLD